MVRVAKRFQIERRRAALVAHDLSCAVASCIMRQNEYALFPVRGQAAKTGFQIVQSWPASSCTDKADLHKPSVLERFAAE